MFTYFDLHEIEWVERTWIDRYILHILQIYLIVFVELKLIRFKVWDVKYTMFTFMCLFPCCLALSSRFSGLNDVKGSTWNRPHTLVIWLGWWHLGLTEIQLEENIFLRFRVDYLWRSQILSIIPRPFVVIEKHSEFRKSSESLL